MATPNKFLEQPARGSNVGVWDTPVNNNTGIIDNAFGGVANVSIAAGSVVLSSVQYQCVFINLTGALTGSVNVTFPAVGSFYTLLNQTTGSSLGTITLKTTAAGSQLICAPPGESCDIFTDGPNVRFRDLGRIGTYWDFAGSSVPAWVSGCTIPPYLACVGGTFSSAVYPVLASMIGTTLPDTRGRFRLALDAGTNRVSSAASGVAGNTLFGTGGDQNAQAHAHTASASVTDPTHTHTLSPATTMISGGVIPGGGGSFTQAGQTVNAAATGITVGVTVNSNLSGGSQNMPPTYVGGITLIRAG